MVISIVMVNAKVKRVFVDQRSSSAIIFWDAFDELGLKNSDLQTYKEELIGFFGEKVYPGGYITVHLTLGTRSKTRTVKMDFLVVDCPSAYNVILGRPTLNKIRAIISTAFLTMKFSTNKVEIVTIKLKQNRQWLVGVIMWAWRSWRWKREHPKIVRAFPIRRE